MHKKDCGNDPLFCPLICSHTLTSAHMHTLNHPLPAIYIFTLSPWQLTEWGNSGLGCFQMPLTTLTLSQWYMTAEQNERTECKNKDWYIKCIHMCFCLPESRSRVCLKSYPQQALHTFSVNHCFSQQCASLASPRDIIRKEVMGLLNHAFIFAFPNVFNFCL